MVSTLKFGGLWNNNLSLKSNFYQRWDHNTEWTTQQSLENTTGMILLCYYSGCNYPNVYSSCFFILMEIRLRLTTLYT